MKPQLLVFDYTTVTQAELLAFADSRPEVLNYFVPVLGTVLLVVDAEHNSTSVTELLHTRFPSMMFAVTPCDGNTANGWMPARFWELVHEPRPSPRWEATLPSPRWPEQVNLRPLAPDAR
jgi:hypothetical protein